MFLFQLLTESPPALGPLKCNVLFFGQSFGFRIVPNLFFIEKTIERTKETRKKINKFKWIKKMQKDLGLNILSWFLMGRYSHSLSDHCSVREDFCLLPFGPRPVRLSLNNRVNANSFTHTLLNAQLDLDERVTAARSNRKAPTRSPSAKPCHEEARLQVLATTPGDHSHF